ncbi:MAG: hypothetical protein ACRD0Z_01920 [Acidimicrobiales bacterium]
MTELLLGVVSDYDSASGLGVVSTGARSYKFHCTAIADGSRLVDTGARVAFVLAPGLGGELEAAVLTPV